MTKVSTTGRTARGRQRAARRHAAESIGGIALFVGMLFCAIGTTTASASSSRTSFPVTVSAENGSVTFKSAPERIVSLSPTATEMLFAIGAGRQVVAVDEDSDYPPSAPRTKLSGLDPNVEAIARYRPDLVVASYAPDGLEGNLKKVGIPLLIEPAAVNLSGTYDQIDSLGKATGHSATAAHLVASMRGEIAASLRKAPHFRTSLTYYVELSPDYYSATSATFIGSVLSLFHLRNIADAAKGASSGYPQLSSEYIVKANPDLIFLADTLCCGQSTKTVAKRPGWSNIAAVKLGGVVGLNDDIASRWGPRITELVADVEQALARLATRLNAA